MIPGSAPEEGLGLTLMTGIVIPMLLYSAWQLLYLYIQYTVIDKDPELVTSLRYLTQVSDHYQLSILCLLSADSLYISLKLHFGAQSRFSLLVILFGHYQD